MNCQQAGLKMEEELESLRIHETFPQLLWMAGVVGDCAENPTTFLLIGIIPEGVERSNVFIQHWVQDRVRTLAWKNMGLSTPVVVVTPESRRHAHATPRYAHYLGQPLPRELATA
jgi:hypothetical protein